MIIMELLAQSVTDAKAKVLVGSPTETDLRTVAYLAAALTLGAMSAIASLLGDGTRALSWRVIVAYLLSGGLASMGLVLLLIEYYGFSYFLVGVAIFAGYKAFDVLAAISVAVTSLVKRILGKQPPNS